MFLCAPPAVSVLGGSALRPAASLPFPARRHASFLAGALEGAARLKPGAAVQRTAPPSPAGSRAALPTQLGALPLLSAATRGPCLPRAPGAAAVRLLLALPDRLNRV